MTESGLKYTPSSAPSKNENCQKYVPPVTLKIAVLGGTCASVLIPKAGYVVGYGTYFGIIFVLLKSVPTTEQPLGTIIPPSTELYLYNTLFGEVKSKLEFASIGATLVYNTSPGLLSTTYSAG